GDDDAIERLEAKIARAVKLQETMKAANKVIRKHLGNHEAQKAGLIALGLSEATASKILAPNCFGSIGFESFELKNNNANIRRMKQRLEQIKRDQSAEVEEVEGEHAKFEDCPAENRVRLYFPDKPAAEVRS